MREKLDIMKEDGFLITSIVQSKENNLWSNMVRNKELSMSFPFEGVECFGIYLDVDDIFFFF